MRRAPRWVRLVDVFVLAVPALLAGPLLLLAAAVVGLASHGPLGWLAAAALLLAVWKASAWCVRRVRAWWRTTAAPEVTSPARGEIRHNQ